MLGDATILLCGGNINYANLPVGTNVSNAMIPVNGKPVIAWIVDDLLAKGIEKNIIVVLREQNQRLVSFLQRAYSDRLDLRFAFLKQEGTILHSLMAGLDEARPEGLVRIILGDTLIQDAFDGQNSFIYISPVSESRRWCLAIIDDRNRIVDYLDKEEHARPPYYALAGYYHLQNGALLVNCVQDAIAHGEHELSAVFRRYGQAESIHAHTVTRWYDFGNGDRLVTARQQLLRPRYFNSLKIDPVLGTIAKISANNEKLQDELDWYLHLPDALQVLAPRILKCEPLDGSVQIVQEYYGYPTLTELYVYGELHADTWVSILKRVLAIHLEFRKYTGSLSPCVIASMYAGKTLQRIDDLVGQDPAWQDLLSRTSIKYNGVSMRGLPLLLDLIKQRAQELSRSAPISIIHGDYCFSNILFDVNNQIMRLIDPRGRFGEKGIYGDARYDMAKLRHSVHECYDYIVEDMFDLTCNDGEFVSKVYSSDVQQEIGCALDRMLVEIGYDLNEIRFIEGLLFLSMLPLHQGQILRQKMMFLTGLQLLDGVV